MCGWQSPFRSVMMGCIGDSRWGGGFRGDTEGEHEGPDTRLVMTD
jgi:hypothetical protein